jgi:hypothetical protein
MHSSFSKVHSGITILDCCSGDFSRQAGNVEIKFPWIPSSSKWPLSFSFAWQNLYFSSPMRYTCLARFLQPPVTSSTYRPNALVSTLFLTF